VILLNLVLGGEDPIEYDIVPKEKEVA